MLYIAYILDSLAKKAQYIHMDTKTTYKGFKIITKKKDGYYQSFMFYLNELTAFDSCKETLKRDAISWAKWTIDRK